MSILVYLFFKLQLFIARVPQTATASRPFSYRKLANYGLLLKFSTAHRLTFSPNFMPICPVTKKCDFIVRVMKKTPTFLAAICAPLAQGAQFNTCDLSLVYICQ